MPYHEEALGVRWEQLAPNFQLLFLTMMKVAGALWLTGCVGFFVILLIPFRRGDAWARWALPAIQIPSLVAINYGPINLALKTGAHPPLLQFFLCDLLFLAGVIFSLEFKKSK
jgi:hypothetical protein